MAIYDELGFYLLAGGAPDPRELIEEVRQGETLGLGSAFISERYDIKEAATLCGAAAAVSSDLQIVTAATNHNTRHPIVTASHATTMAALTRGRYTLGLGRGIPLMQQINGMSAITTAQMEEFALLMRRLWSGETVFGYEGALGSFPMLRIADADAYPIRLALVAFGPNSLELGGRCFDDVILHTFFTDETLQRCVATVKSAAERAGRDPDDVRVWSCYATVGDHIPEPLRLKKTVGRLATYLQGYGDLMVSTNGWDPAALAAFRAHPVVSSFLGAIDKSATTEQLEQIAEAIPHEWLEPAATGSAAQCAAAVRRQMELGADAVIMHGATPSELAPVVEAYAAG